MPKLIVLVNTLSNGGAEKVVSRILPAMKKRIDLELYLLNHEIKYTDETNAGYRIVTLKGASSLLGLFVKAIDLKRKVKSEGVECIQSHTFLSNYVNLFAKLMGSRHRAQVVHCVDFESKFGSTKIKYFIHFVLGKALYLFADLHIFKSSAMAENYSKIFNVKKKVIVFNPVCQAEAELADGGGRVVFVSIGRFYKTKNQIQLLRVLESLKLKFDWELKFFGDGVELDACKKYVMNSIVLRSRVKFFGVIQDISKMISSSDVYISCSLSEGFPNALVECLSMGLVCIHSDCETGPREILISNGDILNLDLRAGGVYIADYGVLFLPDDDEGLKKSIQTVVEELVDFKSFKESPLYSNTIEVVAKKYIGCAQSTKEEF